MNQGVYSLSAAMINQLNRVDVISNNLANASTPGFKKDQPVFREYLSVLERDNGVAEVPRGPIKDKEFHKLDGTDQSFVITDGTYVNFKPGHFQVTQKPLDIALDGPGFFEVSTPYGIRYTKHGSFNLAKDGRLVTSQGYPVLASQPGGLATALPASAVQPDQGRFPTQGGVAAEADPSVSARYIQLGDATAKGPVSITQNGEIYSGENKIASLSVIEFKNQNGLRKAGEQLMVNTDPDNGVLDPQGATKTRVLQGQMETSNVNPIEEMTQLIQANRLFEHNLKAMKTYDQLMEREANEIGKLR